MATERKLKGLNFRGTLDALERQYGADARARVQAALHGELGETIQYGGVSMGAWYPCSWYAELLARVAEEIGRGPQGIRMLSREAIRSDFQTVFRIMRLFLSPELAATQSQRVAKRYIDGGNIEVVNAQAERLHYRLTDFPGYSHLMWWDFIGGVEGVLQSMGAQSLHSRLLAGGQDGDDHIEFVLRWAV